MPSPTATVLLVFGRGVTRSGDDYVLTPGSAARVRAAADYVARHSAAFRRAAAEGRPARIVFSGGWAEASLGAAEPPPGSREGDLMLREALAAGLDRWADLHAETRSRSTLENIVHVAAEGLLPPGSAPLGLVSDAWHLPRIRYLTAKVLGLRGADLIDVPAAGDGDGSERLAYLVSRVCLFGVRDPGALVRRERRMVAWLRRAERALRRRARAAPVPAELLEQVTNTRSALDGRV
ncbi:YdcF family protein [Actinoplanes sp. NPDC049681]|uniref:YdcF family protein n=1 Tax=Actinoplanes sp. NPDC049681 TaxID=3363905 RepID=UPI00379BF1D6